MMMMMMTMTMTTVNNVGHHTS